VNSPVEINLKDGGLGRGKNGVDGLHLKIGVAETGTKDAVYEINSYREAVAKFEKGPLVDAIKRHFNEGGIKCFALRPDNDTAGEIGSVTKTGTGTSVCTATGTVTGTRNIIIEIILGGAHETAKYRWSPDGGVNWSSVYTTPASTTTITLEAGVSVAFGTGTFVAGDTYSFTTSAPTASAAKFLTAIDAARAGYDPVQKAFKFIHIVGGFERSFWESVASKKADFESVRIFISGFILEYPKKTTGETNDYLQTMIDECRLFQDKKIAVVGGRIKYGDDTDYKSAAIMLCANLSKIRTNIHPGFVRDLRSVTGTEIEFWNDGLQDFVSDIDDANIILAVKYDQWPGIYIKKDHLMSPEDSDYQTIHELRPADKARRLAYDKIMPFVNGVAEGGTSGIESLIAEIDVAISSEMEIAGEAEIVGHEVDIDTDQDLSEGELVGELHLYKTNTLEKITIDVGYKQAV